MNHTLRPHLLGIDDGPFHKGAGKPVPLIAVMTEGPDLVESIAVGEFPEDGPDAAAHLAGWIGGLRCSDALHAVVLGGITIAGLGVVDIQFLARRLDLPVIVCNRRRPTDEPLIAALRAAGFDERVTLVEASPSAHAGHVDGLWIAQSGTDDAHARRLIEACSGKSRLPEPLRIAHLIAAALVNGESRGRP